MTIEKNEQGNAKVGADDGANGSTFDAHGRQTKNAEDHHITDGNVDDDTQQFTAHDDLGTRNAGKKRRKTGFDQK